MDIVLIYLLKILVLPVASLSFLAIAGVFYVRKNKGKGIGLVLLPLLSLLLLSLPIVADNFAQSQQKYSVLNADAMTKKKPQAIVVLGGGVRLFAPEYQKHSIPKDSTLSRLRYAAYLTKKTYLPLLVSGGRVFDYQPQTEASVMASVLTEEFNIPVTWLEESSRNTAENAVFSHKILLKHKIKRVLLVTDALHMGRAVEQFERVGLTVLAAPTNVVNSHGYKVFDFLPTAKALELSTRVIHEILGRLWYRLRY